MPGSGKSTIGAALAERLDRPFFDSDAEIERETGRTIARLFTDHGEAHFRDLERATIARLLATTPLILATGGGAMADAATRDLLLTQATTVWLDAPPQHLAARLHGQSHRPLLAGNLNERLQVLQSEREIFYRAAAYRIDAALAPDAVVATILNLLAA